MLTIPNGQAIQIPTMRHNAATRAVHLSTRGDSYSRGRIIWFHGLAVNGPFGWPVPVTNNSGISYVLQLFNALCADGWQVVEVMNPEDVIPWPAGPLAGTAAWNTVINPVVLDIRDDPNHGRRYLATMLKSFDNVRAQIEADLGYMPTVVGGFSLGGWTSTQLILNRGNIQRGLIGAITGIIPCILNQTTIGGSLFPSFDTSGFDLPQSQVNSITLPFFTYWGVQDVNSGPLNAGALFNAAIQAGANIPTRSITDGVISGGTNFSSATACFQTNETSAVIAGSGIPNGTTITVTNASPSAGPYTATLSQTCTNGSGLTCTFPGLGIATTDAHSMSSATALKISNWVASTLSLNYPAVY